VSSLPSVEQSLLGAIYDAALDPRLWAQVLTGLSATFGSGQSMILAIDRRAFRSETLTRAEARLCAVLFEHEGLQEAIAALRIKRNTAKTQMRSIYAKVGVSSQVQLMRFLALGLALGDRMERRH
jgi:DNA-binding CsgD family transcriptional regulator